MATKIIKSSYEAREAMMAKLASSLLDAKDADKVLQMKPLTSDESKSLGLLHPARGFQIPYFSFDGSLTKFWRYRYTEDTRQGFMKLSKSKKPLRYTQPGKTVNEVYLPPFVDWRRIAKDSAVAVVITEGELKAACATKSGFPTIGLGGVWCFKSTAARAALLPQLKEIAWKDRKVFIAYDSDAASNPQVSHAENVLARELSNLGAEPYIVRLQPSADGKKVGLDDLILAEGKVGMAACLEEGVLWKTAQELFQLNEEVVYVRDPGVILRVSTGQRIAPRSFVDHAYSTRVYYEEQLTQNGSRLVEKSAAKEWLRWPARAEVAAVTYEPGEDRITASNQFNVWPGWGCEAVQGDFSPWTKLLDYIFADDKDARDWFEKWCAYPLQHPGTKLYSSSVIWGLKHGTGKSLIGYTLGKIYGRNFTEITDRILHESHNEWAENRQFVMGDEITGGDKRAVADRMKGMITQQRLRLNPKYIPSYEVPDCINYYFTSNHPDSFFVEDDDRRFFIHEVVGAPLVREFYDTYDKWYKGDGCQHLFWHLLNLDLGDFNPRAFAHVTNSKQDMIEGGRSDLGSWVAMLREDPDTVLRMDKVVLPYDLWRAEDLLLLYDPDGRGKVTANGMSRELRRAGFKRPVGTLAAPTKNGRFRLWAVRNTDDYRGISVVKLGEKYDEERDPAKKPKPTGKRGKLR